MTDMTSFASIRIYIHIKTEDVEHSALIAVSCLDILVELLSNKVSVAGRFPSFGCWLF